MNLRVKLDTTPDAPVIDLGTTRRSRAEAKVKRDYLPFFPGATIVEDGVPVQPVPVAAPTMVILD